MPADSAGTSIVKKVLLCLFFEALVFHFLEVAFLLELPVKLFEGPHLLFLAIPGELSTQSIVPLFEFFLLALEGYPEGGGPDVVDALFVPVFGPFPLEPVLEFEELPPDNLELDSLEGRVGGDGEHEVGKGSIPNVMQVLEVADNLGGGRGTYWTEQLEWTMGSESWS